MWEIYAYQGADTLTGVFNAIAAIAGAQDFIGAIAVVAFCGFITAFVAYALAPQKLIGWQWLASSTLILSVLFVPRVQVGIIDKTGGGAERFVDNVPLGLAALASITSTIGNVTASLFETAFQSIPGSAGLPPELAYQKNGLMFGNRMIRKASRVVFVEPRFRTDLINFIGNCTMYDLADGTVAPADFANTGNAWPLMATPNPARFSSITNASGETQIMPCPEVYKALDKVMPLQVKRIHDSLALEMNPTLPPAVVSTVLASQIEQTYIKAKIADAAASAADIVRQNALINAINDTSLLIGQKINDAPAMMLAVGRPSTSSRPNQRSLD
jgi:conjugal transfer mating pair stabilization protein TraG